MQDTSASGRANPGPAAPQEPVMSAARGDAYVLVALARLERDHVALLAALCELETAGKRRARASRSGVVVGASAAMRDALAVLLRADLRQTQHALALAADGHYGACESCHTPLSSVILMTTPATTHCSACVEQADRTRQVH